MYKIVKTYLLGNETVVLWALLLGGIALIVFEYFHQEKTDATQSIAEMSYAQAALIGLSQSIAIIPGVSRSAASIVGGLLVGLRRTTIVQFSFLLAVPTMLAASGLDIIKSPSLISGGNIFTLFIGFFVAFGVAFLSIRFLLTYVRSHNFVPFGIYRIVAAVLFWFIIFH